MKVSLVSMFIYPSISCLCVCLSPSAQSCLCLCSVYLSMFPLLSCFILCLSSLSCICLFLVPVSSSRLSLGLSVCYFPSYLSLCPYLYLSVSLFSFSSISLIMSLSLQCHIAVIRPLMLCALFLHFSLCKNKCSCWTVAVSGIKMLFHIWTLEGA